MPVGLSVAVVLDRSASMRRHAGEVEKALEFLQQEAATTNRFDLYLTAAASRGEPALAI